MKCLYNCDLRSPDIKDKRTVENIETRNSITQLLHYYLSSSDLIFVSNGDKNLSLSVCVHVCVSRPELEFCDLYQQKR